MFWTRSDATHTVSAGDRILSQKMILELQHITLFSTLQIWDLLGSCHLSFPSNLIFFYLEVEYLSGDYFIITLEVRYNLSFHRKKEVLLQDESFH